VGRLPGPDDPLRPEAVTLAFVEARDRDWQDLLLTAARVIELQPVPDVADRVALALRRAVLAGEPIALGPLHDAEIDTAVERRLIEEHGARVPVDDRRRRRSA